MKRAESDVCFALQDHHEIAPIVVVMLSYRVPLLCEIPQSIPIHHAELDISLLQMFIQIGGAYLTALILTSVSGLWFGLISAILVL